MVGKNLFKRGGGGSKGKTRKSIGLLISYLQETCQAFNDQLFKLFLKYYNEHIFFLQAYNAEDIKVDILKYDRKGYPSNASDLTKSCSLYGHICPPPIPKKINKKASTPNPMDSEFHNLRRVKQFTIHRRTMHSFYLLLMWKYIGKCDHIGPSKGSWNPDPGVIIFTIKSVSFIS